MINMIKLNSYLINSSKNNLFVDYPHPNIRNRIKKMEKNIEFYIIIKLIWNASSFMLLIKNHNDKYEDSDIFRIFYIKIMIKI